MNEDSDHSLTKEIERKESQEGYIFDAPSQLDRFVGNRIGHHHLFPGCVHGAAAIYSGTAGRSNTPG
jgi:hypothetical protein